MHQYEYASRSPPALVPAYGERGLSGWSSVIGSDSAVPYTSDEEMRMNRSIGRSRIASSSTCVPTTFVVTNSPPPCSIDFETCDSAAAFTITSTPSRAAVTSARSRMSPWMNRSRSCSSTSARLARLPAYVRASMVTTSCAVSSRR